MKNQRFWEIDALRGLAILRMISYNWSFSLAFLGVYIFEPGLYLPGLSAVAFIFLSGLSMTLSKKKQYYRRGIEVFGWGLLITAMTFIFFRENFIVFGILHLIGVSTILGQFFLKYKRLNIVLGSAVILVGLLIQSISFEAPYLLWLGFKPNFPTFDYFPLLPWFSLTLFGIAAGNMFYRNGKRYFRLADMSGNIVIRMLSFLGRNSLKIYLLHQPLLIAILMLLGFKIF